MTLKDTGTCVIAGRAFVCPQSESLDLDCSSSSVFDNLGSFAKSERQFRLPMVVHVAHRLERSSKHQDHQG